MRDNKESGSNKMYEKYWYAIIKEILKIRYHFVFTWLEKIYRRWIWMDIKCVEMNIFILIFTPSLRHMDGQ